MRLIPLYHKILRLPPINTTPLLIPTRPVNNLQLRERARLARQLRLERRHVVQVHVGVAHDVGQAAGHQPAHVREHVRQQRVAGDVEGHAQAHVAGALVELAVEVAAGFWI